MPHLKERKVCPTDPAMAVGMEATKLTEPPLGSDAAKPPESAQPATKLTESLTTTLNLSYITEG